MKHLFCALIFFLCSVQTGIGQTYSIQGTVSDTLNIAPLYRASVVLIRTTDSVVETFTRTKPDGSFELHLPAQGKYVLRITFPSFADYIDVVNVKNVTTDLGVLAMVSKEHLLKEFVFTQQIAAIKIKGDTTEYMADSFKVKDNATVEDLLKRLPGIQVDKNGQITAQGETVQKILVDGEEFFSDDPKVVTQGLQANALEKVQVYDKKSDQAEFTGVDDGQKTKTINLALKEDKKKGYFGKLNAGGGTDGYFQNQGMINAFKGKRQFAAFGIVSNTDKVGLGWQDNGKFGAGNDVISDGNNSTISINNMDDNFGGWDGSYTGEGLPRVWTGGIHFADKWNEEKDHFAGNYRYSKQNVDVAGNNITQYTLGGDSSNINNIRKSQSSTADRHAIDGMFELKIDSNNSIKVNASAGTKTTQVYSQYNGITSLLTGDSIDTLYHSNRTITSNSNADFINAELLYKRKFAKKGRTLSLDAKENDKSSQSNGHLLSKMIPDAVTPPDSSIDQRKVNNANTLAFSAKATYTEPLSKTVNLELSYGTTVNNTTTTNYSYNSDSTGHYNSLDSVYSSHYKYNILSNTGGLNFRFVNKKITASAGSDISNTRYAQTDLLHGDTTLVYNYINLFPQANFKYSINKQETIRLSYNGSSQQPTITQVQPLRQNTDPSNIMIGNPNLKQQFLNKVDLRFNKYEVLTHRYIYLGIDGTFISNAISTSQNTAEGINTTQYVNVKGNYLSNAWMGYGFKLKKPDLGIGIHFSADVNHTNNFINGVKNTNDNNRYTPSLSFNIYKEDKYELYFTPAVTYNENKATINTATPSYWSSNSDLSASYQVTKKFELGTEVNFLFREATIAFPDNNNIIKWNASVSRKLLKKNALELKLTVFDILNQNIGYSRTAQAGIITQNNYNTIRRYCMLSLGWNFNHTPGSDADKN
jgi:outer membrane beta-barrel protein/carboxypeptidase family protein